MIDEILRNNLIIREWVNGGLIPLNISLVLVIGLFLWNSALDARAWRTTNNGYLTWFDVPETWERFQKTNGVQTGCALFWIFLADGFRAAAAWTVLNYRLNDVATPINPAPMMKLIELVNVAFIFAGVVGLLASLRCIYLFTPPRWGHWYWMGSVVVTLTFQVVT